MKARNRLAPYAYKLFEQDKILIVYEGKNNKEISLTNSIENVISDIEQQRGINHNDYTIVQYNNYGEYDLVALSENRKPSWECLHNEKQDGSISTQRLLAKIKAELC
ncbi:MAG: hypothetical protein GY730_04935 [bacterium]|nr:hypothetical protein [bacterium]